MPGITAIHWALWYVLVYASAIVGAWFLVTVLWLVAAWRRRASRRTAASQREAADLANDPELHRFFARVNHAYRRSRVPPHAVAPPPGTTPIGRPRVLPERAQPALSAAVPVPEPVVVMPDPEVLHSAPFYSPRQPQTVKANKEPAPPPVAPAAPPTVDGDLVALVNLWRKLGEKDRRELLALARLKVGADQ